MSERLSPTSSPDRPRIGAVVVAGGEGLRMAGASGAARKQYAMLLDEPVLAWAIRPFVEHARIATVVVVLPAADVENPPGFLAGLGVAVVAGGRTRSDSVRAGLAALPADTELVLVHDAARPFVTAALIDRVIGGADGAAAIPALRATDTLKEVDGDGDIVATVDRSRIWHAQTPQAFPYRALVDAHADAAREGREATDDAGLFERIGARVRVVDGDPENLKITRPYDLEVARLIAAGRRAAGREASRSPERSG
jgi:2-C-methyl-D-erythritol 4-phosphate cytidylyltransferase